MSWADDDSALALSAALNVPRVTRSEALARHLETEIVADSLRPGQRIGTKDELRQRFGVAAATINEAVRLMEQRGLISARPGPGGGVFVADVASRSRMIQIALGFDDEKVTLRDCVELRDALEPLVCRRALRHAEPDDVTAMRTIVDAMGQVLNDGRTYLRLNWTLHRMIGDLCRSAPLHALYRTVIDVLDEGLDSFEFDRLSDESARIHRLLVDAIASGDANQLEAALAWHRRGSPLPSNDGRSASLR